MQAGCSPRRPRSSPGRREGRRPARFHWARRPSWRRARRSSVLPGLADAVVAGMIAVAMTRRPALIVGRGARLVVRDGDALGALVELPANQFRVLVGMLPDPCAALAALGVIGHADASCYCTKCLASGGPTWSAFC